ncbi:MAG: HAD family hydrolase [Anaerolineaceae bacterium]|nr:HAD family hydrolase [Anaerolineaceae bacterium]
MNLTILSDLDDTLFSLNMDQFFPKYFIGLGNALNDLGSNKSIQKQVSFAVTQMESNQDPGKLLSDIFADNFYAPLGTTEAAHKETILNYYKEEYPKLKPLTSFRPEALELVDWCKQQHINIAIATNPVFPEVATRERILWAGLKPESFPYFTTYEHFHFTKPHMTYYAECLGRLGWPEGKIVMIGDDPMRDIEPMQALGFPTFQIHSEKNGYKGSEGTIAEVRNWLEGIMKQPNSKPPFSPEANIAIMRATPAVMDYWLRFLPEDTFQATPELTEIFWLLADLEKEVYLPQWQEIAAGSPTGIATPDTSAWTTDRAYNQKDPKAAYQKFYQSRMASLEILESLTAQGLFTQSALAESVAAVSHHDRIMLRKSHQAINI